MAEAHHDLPWNHKKRFADHGLDVNNPAFGRWSSNADHYVWHKEMNPNFNKVWDDYVALEQQAIANGGQPFSAVQILQKLQEIRNAFVVTGATYNP